MDDLILQRLAAIEQLLTPRPKPPLYLDAARLELFLAWSRDVQHTTPKWLGDQRRYGQWWIAKLQGCDLRHCDLPGRIIPALDGVGGRAPRIAVLKRIYSWLRLERHELATEEDPTYAQLRQPQSKPAQLRIVKTFARRDYEALRKHLAPHYRAAAEVLAGTGWHYTELDRFARGGTFAPGRVLICPRTKRGVPLRTRVTARVLRAATLVRERGTISEKRFREALRRASVEAGLRTVRPGEFRHSVASCAIEAGEAPAHVAAFLGHQSERTTRTFYATHATPRRVRALA